MAANQRFTSKNTRSEGPATVEQPDAAELRVAWSRSRRRRSQRRRPRPKKAADWGGYFGAKNGQGSCCGRSGTRRTQLRYSRDCKGAGGQRGAGAGRPGNKKPATDLIEVVAQ